MFCEKNGVKTLLPNDDNAKEACNALTATACEEEQMDDHMNQQSLDPSGKQRCQMTQLLIMSRTKIEIVCE